MNLKTTIIVEKRGEGYIYDLFSPRATQRGVRCGITPIAAATAVTKLLAQHQEHGAALVAPPEVKAEIPSHLYDAQPAAENAENQSISTKELMSIMGELIRVVYDDDVPNNVLQYALTTPVRCIGFIRNDLIKAANQQRVAEIIDKIPSDIADPKGISLASQGAFWLAYYKTKI